MRKMMKAACAAALCVVLLTGCSIAGSTDSNPGSPESSTETVSEIASSESDETSNLKVEFESLKDEAENLLEEGKYKEAVTVAAKAYQLTDEKEGEDEIPLRVAEKLAEECGLQNPKAEIDLTQSDTSCDSIKIICDNLPYLGADDDEIAEIIDKYRKLKNEAEETIEEGGIEGGAKKLYKIGSLISNERRYSLSTNSIGKDELVTMNEASYQKRIKNENFLSEEKRSGESEKNQTVTPKYKNGADSTGHNQQDAIEIAKEGVRNYAGENAMVSCTSVTHDDTTWNVKGTVCYKDNRGITVSKEFVISVRFTSRDSGHVQWISYS